MALAELCPASQALPPRCAGWTRLICIIR